MGREVGLDGQDVLDPAVVALRPEMGTATGVDQLGHHAQPVAGTAGAALDHVAGIERAAHLAHVDRLRPVGEGRVPGDHEQIVVTRKVVDDVLGEPVAEIVLRRVATQIVERQDGDRRLAGRRADLGGRRRLCAGKAAQP